MYSPVIRGTARDQSTLTLAAENLRLDISQTNPKPTLTRTITSPYQACIIIVNKSYVNRTSLSGEPDYFGRNEISSGGDLSHYSSASLY